MSEEKFERLSKVARELNIALQRAVDFLNSKGGKLRMDPNAKISEEQVSFLRKEFGSDLKDKKEASAVNIGRKTDEYIAENAKVHHKPQEEDIFVRSSNTSVKLDVPIFKVPAKEPEFHERATHTLAGTKVVGKIELTPKRAEPAQQPKQQPVATVQPPVQQIVEPKVEPIPPVAIPQQESKIAEEILPIIAHEPTVEEFQGIEITPVLESLESIVEEIPTELIKANAETLKGNWLQNDQVNQKSLSNTIETIIKKGKE